MYVCIYMYICMNRYVSMYIRAYMPVGYKQMSNTHNTRFSARKQSSFITHKNHLLQTNLI